MAEPGGVSAWDWAGLAGGAAAALTVFRKAVGWLDARADRRRRSRAEGLQEWEEKLTRREAAIDTDLETRLGKIENENTRRAEENMALRLAFEIVAAELRRLDPASTVLTRANQILATAFPLPKDLIPSDMGAELIRIDQAAAALASK
jgi:hypothetical protein